ncbi:MAG: hypothetical protein CM1200mP30_21830 [Pseudomonadota bacterium]|nr:MAG: hypothetical protein CM1200mP30_21830 [Pseudomonadota bacterium]
MVEESLSGLILISMRVNLKMVKNMGFGKYIQTDGSKYVGEFKDGLKNGQGKTQLR